MSGARSPLLRFPPGGRLVLFHAIEMDSGCSCVPPNEFEAFEVPRKRFRFARYLEASLSLHLVGFQSPTLCAARDYGSVSQDVAALLLSNTAFSAWVRRS